MVVKKAHALLFGVWVVFFCVDVEAMQKKKSGIETAYEEVLSDLNKNYSYFFQVYDENGEKVNQNDIKKGKGQQTLLLYVLSRKDINQDIIKKFLEIIKYGGKPSSLIQKVLGGFGSKHFGDDDEGHGYSQEALTKALNFCDDSGKNVLYYALEKINLILLNSL